MTYGVKSDENNGIQDFLLNPRTILVKIQNETVDNIYLQCSSNVIQEIVYNMCTVFVMISERTITFYMRPQETILNVKKNIEDKEGFHLIINV